MLSDLNSLFFSFGVVMSGSNPGFQSHQRFNVSFVFLPNVVSLFNAKEYSSHDLLLLLNAVNALQRLICEMDLGISLRLSWGGL